MKNKTFWIILTAILLLPFAREGFAAIACTASTPEELKALFTTTKTITVDPITGIETTTVDSPLENCQKEGGRYLVTLKGDDNIWKLKEPIDPPYDAAIDGSGKLIVYDKSYQGASAPIVINAGNVLIKNLTINARRLNSDGKTYDKTKKYNGIELVGGAENITLVRNKIYSDLVGVKNNTSMKPDFFKKENEFKSDLISLDTSTLDPKWLAAFPNATVSKNVISGIDPAFADLACLNNIVPGPNYTDVTYPNSTVDPYKLYWTTNLIITISSKADSSEQFQTLLDSISPELAGGVSNISFPLCPFWILHYTGLTTCTSTGGTYDNNSFTCNCQSGFVFDGNAKACTMCPYLTGAKDGKCVPCDATTEIWEKGLCKECPAGTTKTGPTTCSSKGITAEPTKPLECPTGTAPNENNTACTTLAPPTCSGVNEDASNNCGCLAGYARYKKDTPCLKCENGSVLPGSERCTCNSGFHMGLKGDCVSDSTACKDEDPNAALVSGICACAPNSVYSWNTGETKPSCAPVSASASSLFCGAGYKTDEKTGECISASENVGSSGGCSLIRP